MFFRRSVSSILVAAAACSVDGLRSTSAEGAGASVSAGTPTGNARAIALVDAANAFLSTLSETQRKAVLFAFTDSAQRRVHWSSVPDGAASRSGLPRKACTTRRRRHVRR